MKTRYCLLLALPLALGACEADDGAEEPGLEEAGTDIPAAPAPAVTETAEMPTTVTLAAVGESGVSGEAILTPSAGQTEVTVTLTGLEPSSTHPGHIHLGSCAAPGAVVVPLSEITADSTGSGTMTATAAIATDSATAGNHIVQYHGEGGTPIACGEIMHPM